jgi:undecaprenyl-diphosphatase
MIEYLNRIDTDLFLFINSLHSPFWDKVMLFMSGKAEWIPLYLVLAAWVIYRFRWKSLLVFATVALLIIASDQVSNICKDLFHRLRPCHNPGINNLIHMADDYCGKQYGFVSNHAANTFALASFTSLLFRKKYYSFFIYFWAALVSYSRVYLGVHYPGDILGGVLLGTGLGILFCWLYSIISSSQVFKSLDSSFPSSGIL